MSNPRMRYVDIGFFDHRCMCKCDALFLYTSDGSMYYTYARWKHYIRARWKHYIRIVIIVLYNNYNNYNYRALFISIITCTRDGSIHYYLRAHDRSIIYTRDGRMIVVGGTYAASYI
jgi:hypothetical protein